MTVLLSGGSGFLGEAFLTAWPDDAVCVMRGSDAADRAAALGRRTATVAGGIEGDVTQPFWGIEASLPGLSGTVELVVHLASETSWSASWDQLQHVNVEGSRHAVDVAARVGAPLLHVSTLYVGHDLDHDVAEVLLPERDAQSDYERSKCRAEWVVADRAAELDVPVVIARVGGLLGDSVPRPGARPSGSRVPMVQLISSASWPVVPYLRGAYLDIAPRDLVARRLIELAGDARTEPVAVRHVGLGSRAPLVESVLAEASARSQDRLAAVPRPVALPKPLMVQLSRLADRLGRGPDASRIIGLRYLSSATRYPGVGNLAEDISVATLVSAMGFADPVPLPSSSYYESWLTSSW